MKKRRATWSPLEWQTSPRLRAVLRKAVSNLRMFFSSSSLRTRAQVYTFIYMSTRGASTSWSFSSLSLISPTHFHSSALDLAFSAIMNNNKSPRMMTKTGSPRLRLWCRLRRDFCLLFWWQKKTLPEIDSIDSCERVSLQSYELEPENAFHSIKKKNGDESTINKF
jgi:hypothetical protein